MWVVYTVMAYFLLALLIPVAWASARTWQRARVSRRVTCPEGGTASLVMLDPWFAVRMHALGNGELRVRDCARWPERGGCSRECLGQLGECV